MKCPADGYELIVQGKFVYCPHCGAQYWDVYSLFI
jgi:uncharacterized protein with PIN domain